MLHRERLDRSILSTEIDYHLLAGAISLHELVIYPCYLALGLSDESHALDVAVPHFLKCARTPVLLLPPRKLGKNSTTHARRLFRLCDVYADTKQIRHELLDGLVGRGSSGDDHSLERR